MATVVRRKHDMLADICKFRGLGWAFTGAAGQTTVHDFQMPANRLIEVPIIMIKNGAWGDYFSFSVVDKDNILGYGSNVVLDTFCDTWYVNDTSVLQPRPDLWYSAEVLSGLYLRVTYTSTGGSNPEVKINLNNHAYSA